MQGSQAAARGRRTGRAYGCRGLWRAAALAVVAVAGCQTTGEYMWIDVVPRGMYAPEERYAIEPGDVISIRVWNQEANSIDRTRVRDDGKVSLPFLNDVDVAGSEPGELGHRLEVKLKTFIVNPVVTVVVNERHPVRVSVLGQVVRAGVYDAAPGAGVLYALAAAGGLTPFAKEDSVFVLRSGYWADGNPAPARIRFRYGDLRAGKAPGCLFKLRSGDVVIVE
jgi:polysaccharide export outer membrane protein